MKPVIKKIAVGVLLLLCGATAHVTRTRIDQDRKIYFIDKSPQFLPRGEVLKWLSMGYRGMAADMLWIQTVLYYGRRVADDDNPYYMYALEQGTLEHELETHDRVTFDPDTVFGVDEKLQSNLLNMESRGLVEYIYPMLERVTTLDPHFTLPYFFGGIHVLMDTGEIEKSFSLLEKGYKHNPREWRFPFYLGWIDWMYRGNTRSAQEYMSEAIGLPGCPDYVGSLLVGLTRNLNRKEMTIYYIRGLLESSDSEDIREQLMEVLEELSKEPGAVPQQYK